MKEKFPYEKNGVLYYTEPDYDFEKVYISTRKSESRVLSDEDVKLLPNIAKNHPHYNEWNKRKGSVKRFLKYLNDKSQVRILEIGCGNGWFAHILSDKVKEVVGLDITQVELEQAQRCFSKANLRFVCCNNLATFEENNFDIIVFNASIQYFEADNAFWDTLKSKLSLNGEIHIIDSPIYTKISAKIAKKNTEEYYKSIHQPRSSKYYNHVLWNNIPAEYIRKYTPNKLRLKFDKKASPFPWIQINF